MSKEAIMLSASKATVGMILARIQKPTVILPIGESAGHRWRGCALVAALGMLLCAPAFSNPNGPQPVHGSVTFSRPDPKTLNITNTPNSIINWQGFSIGKGETTR